MSTSGTDNREFPNLLDEALAQPEIRELMEAYEKWVEYNETEILFRQATIAEPTVCTSDCSLALVEPPAGK